MMRIISKIKECFSKHKSSDNELTPERIAQKKKYNDMYLAQMAFMDEYLSDLAEIEQERKSKKMTHK